MTQAVAPGVLTPIPEQLLTDLFADDVPGALRAVADFLDERHPDLDCSEDLRRWSAILTTIRIEAGVEWTDEIASINVPMSPGLASAYGVKVYDTEKDKIIEPSHWRADGGS